jgi:NTE family protein
MQTPGTTKEQKLRHIGAIALSTDTVAESVRREVIERRLPSHEWPSRVLRVTAIDVATGQLVVFDGDSGVDLVAAVAASCAVPGAWPPVTIGDHRYIDGGVGSAVNMAVARDCGTAVVLVPSGENSPSPFGSGVGPEIAEFPGETLTVYADDASLVAFGRNPLDPACRIPSAHAGREQGRREADRVARFLRL